MLIILQACFSFATAQVLTSDIKLASYKTHLTAALQHFHQNVKPDDLYLVDHQLSVAHQKDLQQKKYICTRHDAQPSINRAFYSPPPPFKLRCDWPDRAWILQVAQW